MTIRQTLLYVPTFPDPPAELLLENTVALTARLGSALTAQVLQLDGDPSTFRPVMGGFVADYMEVMAEVAAESQKNATKACDRLADLCGQKKVPLDARRGLMRLNMLAPGLVDLARVHDLVILPAPGPETLDYRLIHAVIFRTGRPVLFLPPNTPLGRMERVVVGWDFSREAARALKDSLPLLRLADEIHLVTVTGEKDIITSVTATDLEKFMHAHGLSFSVYRIEKQFAPVADRLLDHATGARADLLVMGAYGHSRLSEFILGGATLGVLNDPPLPLLLSH